MRNTILVMNIATDIPQPSGLKQNYTNVSKWKFEIPFSLFFSSLNIRLMVYTYSSHMCGWTNPKDTLFKKTPLENSIYSDFVFICVGCTNPKDTLFKKNPVKNSIYNDFVFRCMPICKSIMNMGWSRPGMRFINSPSLKHEG